MDTDLELAGEKTSLKNEIYNRLLKPQVTTITTMTTTIATTLIITITKNK